MRDPIAILTALNVEIVVHDHRAARTVDEFEALGYPPERMVKTLAFDADGIIVLAAAPGPLRLHYGAMARAAGVRRSDLRPMTPSELATIGMEPGAVCPFTDADAVVLADSSLLGLGTVYCGSGNVHRTIEIDSDSLLRASGALITQLD